MQSLAEVRTCSWRSLPCRAPQYIATLRRCKMRERLRSARRAMHARFPFSEALWLEWLDDELPGAREPDARAQAEALLDTAVQDYLSVPVWARYLRCARSPARCTCCDRAARVPPAARARQGWVRAPPRARLRGASPRRFLQDSDPDVRARTDAGLAKFRAVAERALTAAGLHLPAGAQLWTAYRRSPLTRPPVALAALRLHTRSRSHAARPFTACARLNQREAECDQARPLWGGGADALRQRT